MSIILIAGAGPILEVLIQIEVRLDDRNDAFILGARCSSARDDAGCEASTATLASWEWNIYKAPK